MTFRKAYVNLHGNDATGQLDKRWLPFRTLEAATAAGKAAAIPGEVVVHIIDDGANAPTQFTPADPSS